jgi:hypothetical protein
MKHFKPFCLLLIIALLCAAVPRNASAVGVPGLYGGSVTGTQMETNTWPAVTNVYMRPYPLDRSPTNLLRLLGQDLPARRQKHLPPLSR